MRIPLKDGYYAIVDAEDFEELNKYKWRVKKGKNTLYAERTECQRNPRRQRTILMHRQIMKAPQGSIVDHENRNGLDNRKTNLRFASPAENAWNSVRGLNRGASKYKGVKRGEHNRKWRASICHNGKRTHLGYFASEIEAAKAYDAAAEKYRGEFALLNRDIFPLDFE